MSSFLFIYTLGYTGLFSGIEATFGTVRASSASQPDYNQPPGSGSFVGGVGFKFFRNSVPSANFFAMHKLTQWDSFNFFKYPLSNHLSGQGLTTALTLVAKKFATVSKFPSAVGLSDFATYDQNGVKASKPVFPFQLLLVPNPTLTAKYDDKSNGRDYFDVFTKDITAGTNMYTIQAINNPYEAPVIIGQVITTTNFVTSNYADQTLFLKHQSLDEDFVLRPDWKVKCPDVYHCAACPVDQSCGTATTTYSSINVQNPGASTKSVAITVNALEDTPDVTPSEAAPAPDNTSQLAAVGGGAFAGGLLIGLIGIFIVKRRSTANNANNASHV